MPSFFLREFWRKPKRIGEEKNEEIDKQGHDCIVDTDIAIMSPMIVITNGIALFAKLHDGTTLLNFFCTI